MKLWLDDIRQPPDATWTVARTADEAIALLRTGLELRRVRNKSSTNVDKVDKAAIFSLERINILDKSFSTGVG